MQAWARLHSQRWRGIEQRAGVVSTVFSCPQGFLPALRGSWKGPLAQVNLERCSQMLQPCLRTFSRRVSLLSRKFTYCAWLPPFSLSALMQLPSASRERLMWAPSFILLPWFWVCKKRGRWWGGGPHPRHLGCGRPPSFSCFGSGSASREAAGGEVVLTLVTQGRCQSARDIPVLRSPLLSHAQPVSIETTRKTGPRFPLVLSASWPTLVPPSGALMASDAPSSWEL